MLGLWQKPGKEIEKRHFAFYCDPTDILTNAIPFLKSRHIEPYNFLHSEDETPMVFTWLPAVAIYFEDPDGHELEFIGILDGAPRPELGVISYVEWDNATNSSTRSSLSSQP